MQAIPAVLESTKMETVRDKRGEVYACFLGLVVGLAAPSVVLVAECGASDRVDRTLDAMRGQFGGRDR